MATAATRYARSADGVHIAWQSFGSGPRTLVFIAGPAGHLELIWEWPPARRMLERLGTFARVIRLDRRLWPVQ